MKIYSAFCATTRSGFYDDILALRSDGRITRWAPLTAREICDSCHTPRCATAVITTDGVLMIAEWNKGTITILPVNLTDTLHCDAIKITCLKKESLIPELAVIQYGNDEFRKLARQLGIDIGE